MQALEGRPAQAVSRPSPSSDQNLLSRPCRKDGALVTGSEDHRGSLRLVDRSEGSHARVVVTADALHCQREHVAYLAQRGAHWILTVKGNQPGPHQQLADLPWRWCPTMTATLHAGTAAGRSAP